MFIWALFAGLTAVAVVIVLAPLVRGRRGAAATEDGDLAVYRDQLSELDRDREAGLVPEAEAEAARAEISRRLLRAARRGEPGEAAAGSNRLARVVAVLAVVVIPVFSVGGYLMIGRPDLPDAPLARRLAGAEGQSIEALVARVEAHLAANPEDARGWEVVAPVYMRLGRMDDAAKAWTTAIRIAGPSERRNIGLGEALVAAGDGAIGPEAQAAFRGALAAEPKAVLPRMYLAAALSQEGKKDEAVAAWKALVASGTDADPWMGVAREELAKAEAVAAGKAVTPLATPEAATPPGPTAAEVQAAGQMSAADRSKMIGDMVARLDERLKSSGGTIEEWERLVRAYRVMGRTAEADDAIARARTALAADPAATARLDALAAQK
ncbi:c-type cytochrome biogenesis protein CcmI [Pinisolibacter aquiterrae]|uniref:c-type cytochrome biogenesis protein CcmI n=1 Tax=Pinisolibacter aquiterrae TaxID=2815579 RepID=UPI001C3E551D|nr:c-type cytochrome biogenesis protein CcmI [Pinisolibacter aquiterrae]MBV5263153.1 c-type cytochrome biogenesis protein CcmI [Pinisolibacter aquiterrae]MCC8234067.1 c-type cytochrome biogenesis protein CcmI [Pinisolibacter aquiterrae]